MSIIARSITTALVAAMAWGFSVTAWADGHEEQIIKYRVSVMRAIGSHMGAMGANAKGKLGHGADAKVHAQGVANLSKMVAGAFKTKTEGGKTRSKPDVWSDWSGFEKAAMDFENAAGELAAADMGMMGAKMKALGKTCGGCHKKFRAKKK